MRCRKTRLGRLIRRHTSSALLAAAGLSAVGCTGGHLDLSSRRPGLAARSGEETERIASIREDDDQEGGTIERTGLQRVLPFRREAERDAGGAEPTGAGRVFSAFINRLPGRQQATRDPFLDQRSKAAAAPESAASDPRTPTAGVARTNAPTRPVAARTTAPAAQGERSDSELWQMFNADVAGTASVRTAGQKAGPEQTPAPVARKPHTPPEEDSLPLWAQAQQPETRSNARRLPPLVVAQAAPAHSQPESAGRARINPSSKPETVPVAPGTTRREADLRLQELLAEARSHQAKGELFSAYRIAVVAEQFAEREHIVFAPRQERPVDIVREIQGQMQASLSAAAAEAVPAPAVAAPPATVAQQPPAGPVAVTASLPVAKVSAAAPRRTADPFDDAVSQPTQPTVETASVRQHARTAGGRFDSEFPALHEWRGVQANRPVSLAVGNSTAETIVEQPEHPVQHAFATGDAEAVTNQAPLLARAEADRSQMLAAGQGRSLFSGELRSPPLVAADHPDLQPVAAPTPPSAEVAQRAMAAATVGSNRPSPSGLVWWVLGGLVALTGGVALRSRQRSAGRR